MTKDIKRFTALGAIAPVLLGSLGHFIYEWSGNNFVAGLLFATNESVWEHVKLALFPMLLIFLFGAFNLKGANNFAAAAFCAMMTVIIVIPLAFYSYTHTAGRSILAVDILIFILSIVLGYGVAYRLFGARRNTFVNVVCFIGIVAIAACFFTFTYNPPDLFLFKDPTLA